MSDGDEIVGHKTFRDGPMRFRHEPLTRKEADALHAAVEAAIAKRAADMPTEQDAVNALRSAYQRLLELGWKEARYGIKKDGEESRLIELGSSGIHVGYYHAVGDKDVWWIGEEGSPSNPCLVKSLPAGQGERG